LLAYESNKGVTIPIEEYLEEWARSNAEPGLLDYLKSKKRRPLPVLIIDGWDELGDLGGELRQRILDQFLGESYPHVLAVATSRPYATGAPDVKDGFEVRHLQPLNQTEVLALVANFLRYCEVGESEVEKEAKAFWHALERNPGALELARTPLLLLMLLSVRGEELPKRRHELYERVLRAYVELRPEDYKKAGVRYRHVPAKEVRFERAARLAFGLQAGSDNMGGTPLRTDVDSALRCLGGERTENEELIEFLAGPAGVLEKRSRWADPAELSFKHRSFQEFFAGWDRWNATTPEERGWSSRESTRAEPIGGRRSAFGPL